MMAASLSLIAAMRSVGQITDGRPLKNKSAALPRPGSIQLVATSSEVVGQSELPFDRVGPPHAGM
jgi:hypothetical protein